MEINILLKILIITISTVKNSALVLKLDLDMVSDNHLVIDFLGSYYPIVSDIMCEHLCSRESAGKSNLRRYTKRSGLCECMHASEDFYDNRETADKMHGAVLLIDCKFEDYLLLFSDPTFHKWRGGMHDL